MSAQDAVQGTAIGKKRRRVARQPIDFPMVEPIPNTIDALIPFIDRKTAHPAECRIQAITRLGDLMQEHHPDFTDAFWMENPAGKTEKSVLAGLNCLLAVLSHDLDAKIVAQSIGVLSRLKAPQATMSIIDAALGMNLALFDKADNPKSFLSSDDSLQLRCVALRALGRLGDPRALPILMSILNDKNENYRLRLLAAESAGKLGDHQAVSPLIYVLSDDREKSTYLKESAAKALGMLGDIRAIQPLIDVLESKRGIRDKFNFLKEQIIEAIGRLGQEGSQNEKVIRTLLASLGDEASSIRLCAVEALADVGDERCIDKISPLLFDEVDDVAIAAVSTLYHLGGEPLVRDLLGLDNLPQFVRDELESYIP